MNSCDRKSLGNAGEAAVAAWLERAGYTVIQRNFSCRFGEIDLIVRGENLIAFVEVKLRQGDYFALSEVVTPGKQRRIAHTAKYFIAQYGQDDVAYRFDVALVQTDGGLRVTHIPNAFTVNEWA